MYKIVWYFSLLFVISVHGMEIDDSDLKYIDCYFPPVTNETTRKSLLEHAPLALKKWGEDIKADRDTRPILLYGAHGVGKTVTAQAFVKEGLCSLFYIGGTNEISQYSASMIPMEKKTCVILDNIYSLSPETIAQMHAIIDRCATKKNRVHLLAVAYHAQKNMPPDLYAQFQSIKFPLPAEKERLCLLKSFLTQKNMVFADDVDEKYLQGFTSGLSHVTANDIKMLADEVKEKAREEHKKSKKFIISARHIEDALKSLAKDFKDVDENE